MPSVGPLRHGGKKKVCLYYIRSLHTGKGHIVIFFKTSRSVMCCHQNFGRSYSLRNYYPEDGRGVLQRNVVNYPIRLSQVVTNWNTTTSISPVVPTTIFYSVFEVQSLRLRFGYELFITLKAEPYRNLCCSGRINDCSQFRVLSKPHELRTGPVDKYVYRDYRPRGEVSSIAQRQQHQACRVFQSQYICHASKRIKPVKGLRMNQKELSFCSLYNRCT